MSDITIIDNNYPNAAQPEEIKISLKEHQLKLLNKCLELENNKITDAENKKIIIDTSVGIIANAVGSGKSLNILSLVVKKLSLKKNYSYYNGTALFKESKVMDKTLFKNINVLAVPHNIFLQWKKYITDLTTIGTEYVRCKKDLDDIQYDKQLILVSATMYNSLAMKINENNYHVSRLFFDEADSINIPNCQKIQAVFYWFVTSSVNNLLVPKGDTVYENGDRYGGHYDANHQWVRSKVLNHIPGIKRNGFIKDTFLALKDMQYKKNIFLKNCDKLIAASFKLPAYVILKYICKNSNILNVLNNLVSENVQQMICAGDIEGAIRSMNIEKTDETNLIKIIANGLYSDLENKRIDLDSTIKKNYTNKNKKAEDIAKINKEITTLESKINNIQMRVNESNMDPITFCEIENKTIIKCCMQVFDFESITMYITTTMSPKCPMCRTPITKESLTILDNEEERDYEETKEEEPARLTRNYEDYDKLSNLTYILEKKIAKNARLIVFSEHDGTFSNLLTVFNQKQIEWREIKGQATFINKTVEWYKDRTTEKVKVLFLNSQYSGAGLNLENTTDLILYHKMNKELTIQCIGRAHRMGRTSPLNVHQLHYEDE